MEGSVAAAIRQAMIPTMMSVQPHPPELPFVHALERPEEEEDHPTPKDDDGEYV